MACTTTIGALLLGLKIVLLVPWAQAQDRLQLGGCPSSYITTFDFDAKKISEMIGSIGYQKVMTLGTGAEEDHSCQKLHFFEGAAFSYSYMDVDGEKHEVSGRYRATPTSFKTQGFLELSGLRSGVLGANVFGIARLYPLVSRADAHVYLSCSQLGFLHTENVYTFVPNTPSSLRDAEGVRETLALMGVPYSKTLKMTDQACVKPEPPANNTSSDTSASDAPASDGADSNAANRDISASNSTSNATSASSASSSGSSASDTSSNGTSASNASLSDPLASKASVSDALASDPSPSDALSSNASSSAALGSDASSNGVAASDASSSDVLPSGASSNDALASVASSINSLATDALSSDTSSNTAPAASSPTVESPKLNVESNAVEDGPQKASSDVDEESATESSVA